MTELRITVRNLSPEGGTSLTPFWFGFHDGSFDLFDRGAAASPGLEALAEDGNFAPIAAELLAADHDAQGGAVLGAAGPIVTRETAWTIVDVDGASNGQLSLGAMILPSNDAFVGTNDALRLFTPGGDFVREKTVIFTGKNVYDAGTEVNTELDAAFINQTGPDTGIDENGVVHLHPGFNGSFGNPIGEGDQIILGGTDAFGAFIDPVAADFTLPGAKIAAVHINTVKMIEGTSGVDRIKGGKDDDLVSAGAGNDDIKGRGGWDVLDGEAGNDAISGGRGDDVIIGGLGDDFLRGGLGSDLFIYNEGDGHDVIFGFNRPGGYRNDDVIALDIAGIESFDDLLDHAHTHGQSTLLDFGDGSILLRGTALDDLQASDFLFG